jgi:hypothetical protein
MGMMYEDTSNRLIRASGAMAAPLAMPFTGLKFRFNGQANTGLVVPRTGHYTVLTKQDLPRAVGFIESSEEHSDTDILSESAAGQVANDGPDSRRFLLAALV